MATSEKNVSEVKSNVERSKCEQDKGGGRGGVACVRVHTDGGRDLIGMVPVVARRRRRRTNRRMGAMPHKHGGEVHVGGCFLFGARCIISNIIAIIIIFNVIMRNTT